MKNIKIIFTTLLAVVFVAAISTSCSKDKYPGFSKTEDGLFYKFHKKGSDTTKAQIGDQVQALMVYRTMKDSTFSKSTSNEPFTLPMLKSTYKGDVFAAIRMMSPGDSATFIINTDSFFQVTVGAPRPAGLDSGSVFYLDISLVKILKPADIEAARVAKEKEMLAKEDTIIKDYINSNKLNITKQDTGIYFMKNKIGKGASAVAGSYAKVNIVAKILGGKGMEFINTYTEGKPIDIQVGTGQLGIGFENAITQMKVGDKATFIVPFSYAFGAQGMRGFIPPFATLAFDVELIKVTSADEMKAEKEKAAKQAATEETSNLKKYISTNKITVKPTESGLYYISELEGTGKQATVGKKVRVQYTGYLLNGTKFDSSLDRKEPFEFTLGQGQVIPGWDEGVSMMKEGGKAKLIIPSKLAYGPNGAGKTIPPSSPLVFEVELVKVLD